MDPFRVRSELIGAGAALHVHGDLDLATSPTLAGELESLRASATKVTVIDLTECTFIDSSGSRAIIAAANAFGEDRLELSVVCPPENRQVMKVFELVGMDSLVTIRSAPAAVVDGHE